MSQSSRPSSQQGTAVDILSLLDSYNRTQLEGNERLKSSIWELTKARSYQRGRGALPFAEVFNSEYIREDLQAIASLGETEPRLEDEEEEKKSNGPICEEHFLLIDTTKETNIARDQKESQVGDSEKTGTEKDGLRRRKGPKAEKSTATEWSVDQNESEETKTDPIEMFGILPPKNLKKAQKEAQEALAAYVKSANLAVALLERLNMKK